MWLKCCRYGVKHYPINQAIMQEVHDPCCVFLYTFSTWGFPLHLTDNFAWYLVVSFARRTCVLPLYPASGLWILDEFTSYLSQFYTISLTKKWDFDPKSNKLAYVGGRSLSQQKGNLFQFLPELHKTFETICR